MKRIIVSAGLVALGAVGVQAATHIPEFASVDGSKPWSISATLRGFYDDNPGTQPDGPNKQDSFGFQVVPAVSLSLPLGQTSVGLSYAYSLKYFENQPVGSDSNYDQTHMFNFGLDRAFSERYKLSVTDSFVIGQEPDALRSGHTFSTFQRIPGDNIVNFGTVTLNAQMTRLFGVEVGYANAFYDYDESGPGSYSATLDRIENLAHIDGRWQVFRETVGIVGYQYSQVDYTGDEVIGGTVLNPIIMSDFRNSRSHYVYVGAEHDFRADLSGSVRAGARYIDYYNDPESDSEVSPYVQASLQYSYTTDSFARVGFGYDRNPTSRFSAQGNSVTLDAESLVAFASLSHRIVPNLYGSVTGQFQNSTFNGGSFNDETDNYYLVDLNLEYRFNPYLSAEVGYNYDQSVSEVGGSFTRNRVYLGVTASY